MVLLSKVPGITMFAPSSYQEVGVMLHDALAIDDGPSSLRWSRSATVDVDESQVGHGLSARRAREGDRVCLIGVGKMLWTCLEAADTLAAEGIEATVWDPRVIKPLDPVMLDDALGFDHVVTVEDGFAYGGIGSAVAAELALRSEHQDRAPRVRVMGVPTEYLEHGDPNRILSRLGLDAAGITNTVLDLLS